MVLRTARRMVFLIHVACRLIHVSRNALGDGANISVPVAALLEQVIVVVNIRYLHHPLDHTSHVRPHTLRGPRWRRRDIHLRGLFNLLVQLFDLLGIII